MATKIGTAGMPGLLTTKTNSPAHSRAMTRAGRKSLRKIHPVLKTMKNAGQVSWTTILEMMKEKKVPTAVVVMLMTMMMDGMNISERIHHAKNKTGAAGRIGLKKTKTNSPAHSKAMTNAGGNGLMRTLLVLTMIGTAGTPGPTTSLVMAKTERTNPNLKDHHATMVTGTVLTHGLWTTRTNSPAKWRTKSAGLDGS